MSGIRLAAKGVALAFIGVALYLFGIVMIFGPAFQVLVIGVAATTAGGAIVGWTLRGPQVFAGGLVGAAGLAGIVAANLGLVPRDSSAFFLGGVEVAAFGIGVLVGGWLRLLTAAAARRNSGALRER